MPPGRPQPASRPGTRRSVVVALLGVIAGVAVFVAAISLAGSGKLKQKLGDPHFTAGPTSTLAKEIDKRGPILFPDASPAKQRDIYLQHIGDDTSKGWLAIAAHPPGESRECFLRWNLNERHFEDCRHRIYPPDGGTLPRYPTRVVKDRVIVDFPKRDR